MIIHTPRTFFKFGLKQKTTWIGLIGFICFFYKDIHTLVHNILTSAALVQKIITGLGFLSLVLFNRYKNK